MALLDDPRNHHIFHLALLGVFLFFDTVTMALSAAYIHKGVSTYWSRSFWAGSYMNVVFSDSLSPGYYPDASGLILAASVLSIIATLTL